MATPLNDTQFHQAWKVRYDRAIPADERRDIDQAMYGQMLDPSRVRQLQAALPQGMGQAATMLHDIEKAIRETNRMRRPEKGAGRRNQYDDPLTNWTTVTGVIPRLGRTAPGLLRAMAQHNPILQACIQLLVNRTLRHAKYVESGVQAMLEGKEGFDFFPTFKDPTEELSDAERQEKMGIVNFLLNSGHAPRFTTDGSPNREDLRRESFEQMLAIQTRERFILDARALELERTRNGKKLIGMYAVDGATIFRTDLREWPYLKSREAALNPTASFAQVWRNQIVTSFGSNDLYYDYANPSAEVGQRGYGLSEVEMAIRLTTGILNILTTNNAIFDRSALPPGILSITGQISQDTLDEIRDEWDTYRLGAGGQWGMPMFNIRDPQGKVSYLRTDGNPSEMVFSAYINFLAAIICSIFGIDVTEVNVSPYGGSNAGLASGKDTQTRIDESRNRSFAPYMQRLEASYNDILAPNWDYRWRFGWVGLQRQEPEELRKSFMKIATVDEVRQTLFRLKPIGGTQGAALCDNPAVSQMTIAAEKSGDGDLDGKPDKEAAGPIPAGA